MQNSECRRQKQKGKVRKWRRCLHSAFCILNCAWFAACSPSIPIQVSQSGVGAYEAALATDSEGFAVAWYDTRDGNAEIYLRLVDAMGHPSGPERRLTETPEASYKASLERLGDTFILAWYEQTTNGRQTAMLGAWNRDGSRKWSQRDSSRFQESGDPHE